jgi:hypothetical protein
MSASASCERERERERRMYGEKREKVAVDFAKKNKILYEIKVVFM